jgi:hypothetical protein
LETFNGLGVRKNSFELDNVLSAIIKFILTAVKNMDTLLWMLQLKLIKEKRFWTFTCNSLSLQIPKSNSGISEI